MACLFAAVAILGCTRAKYRQAADFQVHDVVAGATANPRFEVPDFDIAIDSASRLFDPTDPDKPPMPPDDPDSARLMESVAGHRGWNHWHKNGDLLDVEIHDYAACLPYDADHRLRVDQTGAFEIARLHSRDFQQQMETLYLSALDVTAERFRFEMQFFGGNTTTYTETGGVLNGGPNSRLLTSTSAIHAQRLFTTGSTLVVGLANTIMWQFVGPDTYTNTSIANFAFSQPLLQFAGKPRIMETLTRAERNLLANVRTFDRYQQGFYLDVTTGTGTGGTSLQRAGGLFGGSGLTGFTGVGVGGFGGVGAIGIPVSSATGGGGGAGAANLGGFLGFLQQQQFLRNQRARIAGLRDTWLQLEAMFDAGRLENRFQVDFARQAYFTNQSVFMNNLVFYETALDQYKVRLGLPPHLALEPRDTFFDQFKLINPELTELQSQVGDRLEEISAIQMEAGKPVPSRIAADCAERATKYLVELESDLKVAEANLPRRKQALEILAGLPEVQESHFDLSALSTVAVEEILTQLYDERARVTKELEAITLLARMLADEPFAEADVQHRAEKDVLTRLSAILLELTLLQARSRLHGISLVPVQVSPEIAFHVALSRRADWMNAKASLVDTWRLIRFNANALRSNVSVNVIGDIGTTNNDPLNFSSVNGRLSAGVTVDAPLTRLIERNQYRESLIVYQQARRSLMQYRDEIQRGLRARLRQIRLDQFNLELRRLAVDVAITQTDVARLKLVEPQKPVTDGKVAEASPTVARDLVDALQNLNDTQQNLIQVWGDYEVQRRLLDFDLGTMMLDGRGMWLDPGSITDDELLTRCYAGNPFPYLDEFGSPSDDPPLPADVIPPTPQAAE